MDLVVIARGCGEVAVHTGAVALGWSEGTVRKWQKAGSGWLAGMGSTRGFVQALLKCETVVTLSEDCLNHKFLMVSRVCSL